MNSLKGGFTLNGCDAFMLAMDHAMVARKSGYHQDIPPLNSGNICHLLLTFSPDSDVKALGEKLLRSTLFQSIANLRLSSRRIRGPAWIQLPLPHPLSPPNEADWSAFINTSIETTYQLEEWILNHPINPRASSPLGFLLLPSYSSGPSVLFFWHHALTDAKGGELLIQQLGVIHKGEVSQEIAPPSAAWNRPLKDSLGLAHRTKGAIFKKSAPSIVRIPGVTSQNRIPQPTYSLIEFSPNETKKIDVLSQEVCNGMFSMAMYLAASTRAASPFFSRSGLEHGKIFIPVPHDMRRFTREKSPLSNQVSFLFFSLECSSTRTLKEDTALVIEQLHNSVFSELHWGMLSFLRLLKCLPSQVLWRTIEQPTKGHPASMYFSDIGSNLSQMTHFGGFEVKNAIHYPPVLVPPGLTTVWSRYRDALRVTICFDQNVLSKESIDTFIHRLRKELRITP